MKQSSTRLYVHRPMRDILLNRDELGYHAQEVARQHSQATDIRVKNFSLLDSVADNMAFLKSAHSYIDGYVKETKDIVPAAEWFLDNFYLLKDLRLEIQQHLPRKYELQLPKMTQGPFYGYPRIFALMVELIEHTDSHLQLDTLKEFVNAYQTVTPLSSGEIWAIPLMLKIALLENIRRLVEGVIYTQDQRKLAERWLLPFQNLEHNAENWEQVLQTANYPEELSPAFAERLLKRLREFGPDAAPILHSLDKQASKFDASLEGLAKLERQNQAMLQVSIGHSITSLRYVGEEDWPKFFEEISLVEKALQDDPAQVYKQMDFDSRDKYRHKVEKLARMYRVSELVVAKKALDKAGSCTDLPETHVGFYLLGKGLLQLEKDLEQDWGKLRQVCSRVKKFLCANPQVNYLSGVLGLTVIFWCTLLAHAWLKGPVQFGGLVFLGLVLLVPVSSVAIALVNWAVTRIIKPTFLPKLELAEGIPASMRTIVVIPTLLTGIDRVKELFEQIEVYFLANQDKNLHFALLGDFKDAPQENMPEDEEIINSAVSEVERINQKYGADRFYLFNRRRLWNPAEGIWMGWERKRGKLVEFNRALLNQGTTSFNTLVGDAAKLADVRYVITLDADTILPRDAAKKLIGTIAHPLQAPRLNDGGTKILAGYGIIQPRIAVSILSAGSSYFAKVFAGKPGVDPYTSAVSDVYQDLFGEGNFTGKGIYDVAVFHALTGDNFSENKILSHDLIEGIYARTGLATDIELIDGYPGNLHAYMRRLHRWVRGDWQIMSWMFKGISHISRWKVFDNLRRSLEALALVLLILFSFVFPGNPYVWLCLALLTLLIPCLLGVFNSALNPRTKVYSKESKDGLVQFVLLFCFLPYQAYVQFDAIVRSLYRQFVSHRKLLEWETAADTDRRLKNSTGASWKMMAPAVIAVFLLGFFALSRNTFGAAVLLPIIILWFVAPWIAYAISKPSQKDVGQLTEGDRKELRIWARKIWAFFEDFVVEKDNWLPPDNVQIEPPNGIAHRTSPTNIGLALMANQAARELGYLSITDMQYRMKQTLDSIDKLESWKGHLYNWYDTQTLRPLQPLYVSTVDSGNLVVYFLTLESGLKEALNSPVFGMNYVYGLKDTYDLLREELTEENQELSSFGHTLENLSAGDRFDLVNWYNMLREGKSLLTDNSLFNGPWGNRLRNMVDRFHEEMCTLYSCFIDKAGNLSLAGDEGLSRFSLLELADYYRGSSNLLEHKALKAISRIIEEAEELQSRLLNKAMSTDFKPLYDQHRQLFSIGYRIGEHDLDKSYYDLLASEARQASYVAIAKGDIPKSHWFRLGRSLTVVRGKRSLVSWSGTMFEFLMPLLLMRNFPGTILDETYSSVVQTQIWYGAERKVPWGISESGFYTFDAQLNYQYKAFGVPGLGLKRGLIEELVVAPYASFLALMVSPAAALNNIRSMERLGFGGQYGLYEAADYTKERIKLSSEARLVQSFMAHHQGMSLLSLTNVLFDNVFQRRFHLIPLVQSAELLLQERVPVAQIVNPQPAEREVGLESDQPMMEKKFVVLNTADSVVPVTHFLSNGQYSVMLTNSGSGFSKFDQLNLTRWREDVTRDAWGMYFYIQNLNSGDTWSATHQPCGYSGEDYRVVYAPDRAEYHRKDGNITTRTEVIVSPEDMVEIRRITLTNTSQHDRTVEITSYFEVVLARLNEDLAHPVFGNLFIETEFTHQALLASRRPRRDDQGRKWIMHTVAVEGDSQAALQYETDRYKFVGRGRNLLKPKALDPNHPLSGTVGAVLDPILSLRQRVRLKPGQSAKVSFSVGIGESRDEVIRLAEKYRDVGAIERVFELAWTFSQMELRHLNISPAQANDALALGGNLLYLSPCRREFEEEIKQNSRGQSALWPYAVSGDLPVILVRIADTEHLDFVRQLLITHEYWRLKGLAVDLVILNEDKSGYFQALQDNLRELISVGHARELLNRPGGIFLLQKNHMPQEDVNLLFAVAKLVFSAEGGSCLVQFRKLGKELVTEIPEGKQQFTGEFSGQTVDNTPYCKPYQEELLYYNGYGGFTKDGLEYVINIHANKRPPLPWINVVANRRFGFQVTEAGGGYTWSVNSRENKLTPWSNDPVIDPAGEVLFLRDEETGDFWSPIPGSLKREEPYSVRHGKGYTVFQHESRGLSHELRMFVPQDAPVKVVQLTLSNLTKEARKLTSFYYAELVMGVAKEISSPYLVTEFDQELNCILVKNTYQEEFAGRRFFLSGLGGEIISYTGDRTEFIGRNESLLKPLAMGKQQLLNSVGAGLDPCAALQMEINLGPEESKQVYFLLGEGEDLTEVQNLLSLYRQPEAMQGSFQAAVDFWQEFLGRLQVKTPDPSMDLLLNGWLLYQTVVCRIWARSAFYQSGGAYGFRDQLQDVMALTVAAPHWTREQILLHCAHQFIEGDVQHWWHAEKNKGIRTKFSDDLLWLPFVTADYLEHTQDYSVLEEMVQYLEDEPLGEDVDERYSVPRVSEQVGSVYEHCIRAIERGLKFGQHGLPLIGSGDWNDGFSRVGVKGRGESVWLGWFIYLTLQRFMPVCEKQKDLERSKRYRSICEELQENLERHGWDGGWYRRAYFDDGSPMGSSRNQECQIDALAQSWAVLSGAARPARAQDAMLALEHYLIRKDEGILLLLTPPFDKSRPDPGYIKGYVPGVRENGGQYTHGAIWSILAFAKMGEGDKAGNLFHLLNPINHARTENEVAHYKVEPYVMTADVYAIPPHVGRGGWSWYTGASGWMYQAGVEGILGFRLEGDKLYLDPCIPENWAGFNIKYRYKSAQYLIEVQNSAGKSTGIQEIILDEKVLESGPLTLQDDGREHTVICKM